MNGNTVITIGRETGSGGHIVGEKLAERLNIRYYDKELLTMAAKESGMCEEIFHTYDEKPNNSFLFSTVMDTYSIGGFAGGHHNLPINHKIFLAQFDTIKKLADRESCVIIGRCADYALSDYPNTLRVFITANEEDKIKLIMKANDLSESKARDAMIKNDKKRANYYNYYTSKEWGKASSYDLCINTSYVGYDGAVEMILEFLNQKREFNRNRGSESIVPEK